MILKALFISIVYFLIVALFSFNSFGQVQREDNPTVDSKTQVAVIDSISKVLDEVYVFSDVAKKMGDLVKKNYKEGKYKKISNMMEFINQLTKDLQSVSLCEDRPKFKLIPMGDDSFMVEGLDYFRIKFNKDNSGKAIEIVGMYDNGDTDSNPRSDK